MISAAMATRGRPDYLMGLFPINDTRRVARCSCGYVWTIDKRDDAPACPKCVDGKVATIPATSNDTRVIFS